VRYMLLIYGEDGGDESLPEDELRALYQEYFRLGDDLRSQSKLVSSEELAPATTATSVQVRGGDTLVTDGPFAETKETLGGYYLIEADSLDEAIEWASRIPAARDGKVEIRPVHDNSGYRE
jgi:hypothetical protein